MARPADGALPDYADAVLSLVEAIPPGRVLAYGDIAAVVGGGGPRQVGAVLSRYGGAVPWWRVVRADGRPAAGHERAAAERYRVERTPLRPDGDRVDMRRARWSPPTDTVSRTRDAAADFAVAPAAAPTRRPVQTP